MDSGENSISIINERTGLCFFATQPGLNFGENGNTVTEVLQEIKERGDEALQFYTEKFDGIKLSDIEVSAEEWDEADNLVPSDLKVAMKMLVII